ncbi:hypothetical protein H7F51_11975 [Novosphingobium flavum]|uniref:Uncharacterized protein n=1 Tax=Novosphingobium flavum TaxID=1778672 RepID=A0A7X1KM41_9SPHN|nr:SCE4755 family polysaccharide monooxygenase-like protein [Novosphingobium flavum]MBC2666236.1 hypothetical protein [Novosphingobium flavum]
MNGMGRKALMSGLVLAAGLAAGPAAAHFRLISPVPTLIQDEKGDPQKKAPCGGTTANPGKPSGAVTDIKGGQPLHFKLTETVFHPGHYRVSLARAPEKLPADPTTTTRPGTRGPISTSTMIAPQVLPPLLADGLFMHMIKPAAPQTWEIDLRIPNVDCANCVIQVVQWMGEHGFNPDGEFSYHHCAVVNIKRDPKLPADRAWLAALKI